MTAGISSAPPAMPWLLVPDGAAVAGDGRQVPHKVVASEFEGLFMSLLIKSMRTSMTEEGLFGSESSDTFGGLFDLYMGRHMATSGGLGIGQMLETYQREKPVNELQQPTDRQSIDGAADPAVPDAPDLGT